MNEENKNSKSAQSHSDGQQSVNDNTDGLKQTEDHAEQSAWKKFLAKKWAFPAMYMGAAVIILGLMWTYQQGIGQPGPADEDPGLVTGVDGLLESNEDSEYPDALPVTGHSEEMKWPVANYSEMMVVRPFYDKDGSVESRQAAVIHYDDMYLPSTGISLAAENGESFDVLAAMSGTVTRVEQNAPLVGQLVEITHENGLKTIYSSLDNIEVELNEQVEQGQVIAQAGRNELERDLGVHLHFEVTENGEPVNPNELIEQSEEGTASSEEGQDSGEERNQENSEDAENS